MSQVNQSSANLSFKIDPVDHAEAQRQLGICTSCRYCEGYCAAFKSVTRHRTFDVASVSQIANLCHNCRGCYYACQYTEPHEFALNIPALLANVRAQSWEENIQPQVVTRQMQRYVWPYALLVVLFLVLFSVAVGAPWISSSPFYSLISHNTMVLIFLPLFILPVTALILGVRRYWKSIGGEPLSFSHLKHAFASAATMKQLNGGQGQGCNYEAGERYTSVRRWAHQATMYGFLLCFLSTTVATVYHYLFNSPAPYSFFSLPKLFGVSGGLLLTFGSTALLYLKRLADSELGSEKRHRAEYTFTALLLLVGLTGLLLYWSKGTPVSGGLLIVHLSVVATFFIAIPYSKMSHGFFRLSALCREAQLSQ